MATSTHNTLATISVVGLVVALVVMIISGGSDNSQQNVVSVSGMAELTVQPDKAEMYISIITNGTEAVQAQDRNRDLSQAVMDALKDAGIAERDMETTSYNLYPTSRWDSRLQHSINTGYELRHTLKVTTNEVDEIGKYADIAVRAGANSIQQISFSLSKELEQQVRDQALGRAGEAAKAKADSIASTMGIRLGSIVAVQESNFYFTPYDFAPMARAESAAMDAAEPTRIAPQSVDVRASISVQYAIR